VRRQLLHPATLIATLALLVALELPSDAARLIDGKLLARGSVSGAKLKRGSIAERKLTAAVRAKLAFAGQTGAAGPAGPAGPGGQTGERGPAGAALSCSAGTALHELACIELATRPQARWFDALAACQQSARRLPTFAELQAFRFRSDLNPPATGSEWADMVYGDSGSEKALYMTMNLDIPGTAPAFDAAAQFTFRCVAPATVG
jgi:hypothetical protein